MKGKKFPLNADWKLTFGDWKLAFFKGPEALGACFSGMEGKMRQLHFCSKLLWPGE